MLIAPITDVLIVLIGLYLVVARRRSGAGEVVHLIDLEPQRMRDIVPDQLKVGLVERCSILDFWLVKNLSTQMTSSPARYQPIAEMRSKKAGAASDEDAFDHGVSIRPKNRSTVQFDAIETHREISRAFRRSDRRASRPGGRIPARRLFPSHGLRRSLTVNPQKHRTQSRAGWSGTAASRRGARW
jgi:hypothetical protein